MGMRLGVAALAAGLVLAGAPAAGAEPQPYTQDIFGPRTGLVLDILIVPPVHGPIFNSDGALDGGDPMQATPFNTYLGALEDSIDMWRDAAGAPGLKWLKKTLRFNVYVLGRDDVPPEAIEEPEVVITTSEYNGVAGVAVWSSESTCLVNNSMFAVASFNYEDMFNVNAQEFGHCLGLGHIQVLGEDANAYDDPYVGHDVMNGLYADEIGAPRTHLHCLSNLNLGGIERIFGVAAPTGYRARYPVAAGPQTYDPDVYCPGRKR